MPSDFSDEALQDSLAVRLVSIRRSRRGMIWVHEAISDLQQLEHCTADVERNETHSQNEKCVRRRERRGVLE